MFEAPVGLLSQFVSQRQVALGRCQVNMSEKGREPEQQILQISPLAVARHQPMNGKGVSQIMQPRLITRSIDSLDIRLWTQLPERPFDGRTAERRSYDRPEKGAAMATSAARPAWKIIPQNGGDLAAQRNDWQIAIGSNVVCLLEHGAVNKVCAHLPTDR